MIVRRVLLYTPLVLLLLSGVLWLTQTHFINWEQQRAKTEALIQEILPHSVVQIEKLQGNFFSLTLKASSFNIRHQHEGHDAVINIYMPAAYFKVLPLQSILARKLKLYSIKVDYLDISTDFYQTIAEFLLEINNHNKTNARFIILDGSVRYLSGNNIVNIQGVTRFGVRTMMAVSFSTNIDRYTVNIQSSGSAIRKIDLAINTDHWKAEAELLRDIQKDHTEGTVEIIGNNALDLTPLLPQALQSLLEMNLPWQSLEQPFTLQTTITKDKSDFALSNLNFAAQNLKFSAKVQKTDRLVKTAVDVQYLELNALERKKLHITQAAETDSNRAPSFIVHQFNNAKTLEGSIHINAESIKVREAIIQDVALHATIKNGILGIQSLQVKLPADTILSQECQTISSDDRTSLKTDQCVVELYTQNASEFLEWLHLPDSTLLTNTTSNVLDMKAFVTITPYLVQFSKLYGSFLDASVGADITIKLLKDRAITYGRVHIRELPSSQHLLLEKHLTAFLEKLDKQKFVIALSTLPVDFQYEVELVGDRGQASSVHKPNKISFRTLYTGNAVQFNHIQITTSNKTKILGKINITLQKLQPLIHVAVDAPFIHLSPEDSTTIFSVSHFIEKLQILRPLSLIFNGEMNFRIGKLRYKKQTLQNTSILAKLKNNVFIVQKLESDLLKGAGTLKGHITLSEDKQASGVFSGTLQNINCGQLSSLLLEKHEIKGYCSVSATISTSHTPEKPWIKNINGSAKWIVVNFSIDGFDLDSISQNIMFVSNESELVSLLNSALLSPHTSRIGNLSGTTTIQNSLATNVLLINGSRATGSGIVQVLLHNLLLNGIIRFNMIPYRGTIPINLELSVKGTLFDYDTRFDINKLKVSNVR